MPEKKILENPKDRIAYAENWLIEQAREHWAAITGTILIIIAAFLFIPSLQPTPKFFCYERTPWEYPLIDANQCGNYICEPGEREMDNNKNICIDCLLVPTCELLDSNSQGFLLDYNHQKIFTKDLITACHLDTKKIKSRFIIRGTKKGPFIKSSETDLNQYICEKNA